MIETLKASFDVTDLHYLLYPIFYFFVCGSLSCHHTATCGVYDEAPWAPYNQPVAAWPLI